MIYFETRWALLMDVTKTAIFPEGGYFVGRFCWQGATQDDIQIPTFRTRKLAREAKKTMGYYSGIAKIVKVVLTIETIER